MNQTQSIDLKIFCPVGTSLVSNNENDPINVGEENAIAAIPGIKRKLQKTHFTWEGKDCNPAEISSLYAFCKERDCELADKTIQLILLHSPGIGQACAKAVKELLGSASYFPYANKSTWIIESEKLEHLDPCQAEHFALAIQELTEVLKKGLAGFTGPVYLNVTGGYKALTPYLTMLGLALGGAVKIFYLFAEARKTIELPTFPVAFDLLEWRDWRGLLLPFTLNLGLTDDQKKGLQASLPQGKLSGLIQSVPPFALSPVGQLMWDHYERQRGTGLSEFGTGALLLDQCPTYRSYLENSCLPLWRHLSVGDHIPETVEHGRGHVQRLLELTQQLLVAMPHLKQELMQEDQFFVLISSIWLHDLGHSGDCFSFEGIDGLIQDKDDSASTELFHTYGDPDTVRRYHHCLTYELLKRHEHFLFPPASGRPTNSLLFRSVQLACLYHRQEMPMQGRKVVEGCCFTKGLKDFAEDSEVIPHFPLVAALLRFLDGLENQRERSGSEAYHQVASWVINRQVESLNSLAESLDSADVRRETILSAADFKAVQIDHYRKHRNFRHVFLVAEPPEGLEDDGVYGRQNSCLLGVYLVAASQPDFNEEEAVRKIVYAFLSEFKAIQELLRFKMALFIIEENSSQVTKKQVVIDCSHEDSNDWTYHTNIVGTYPKP